MAEWAVQGQGDRVGSNMFLMRQSPIYSIHILRLVAPWAQIHPQAAGLAACPGAQLAFLKTQCAL